MTRSQAIALSASYLVQPSAALNSCAASLYVVVLYVVVQCALWVSSLAASVCVCVYVCQCFLTQTHTCVLWCCYPCSRLSAAGVPDGLLVGGKEAPATHQGGCREGRQAAAIRRDGSAVWHHCCYTCTLLRCLRNASTGLNNVGFPG